MFRALITVVLLLMVAGPATADKASDAYAAALASGDDFAIASAQSCIAPPYCYDLNRWHGVVFETAINGRVDTPAYPFTYQDMTHLKVRKLYDRAGIAEMEAAATDELDLIRRLCNWSNSHWGHMQPLPYATWDAHEILDKVESGDAFWCTFKAALFVQSCNAAGLSARMLGINPRGKAAHTVAEVYSNQYRKWMLVDAWFNSVYIRDGVPISARELHDAMDDLSGIELWFGAGGKGTDRWAQRHGSADSNPFASARIPIEEDKDKGLSHMYYDVRIVLRNDHTVHPQSQENLTVDGYMIPYNARGGEWWGPQLKWADDTTMPQITCPNTSRIGDFEWALNEVKVDLAVVTQPGASVVIEARFDTMTPSFSHYRLAVDGAETEMVGDTYRWELRPGRNALDVASVNAIGRAGFPSTFVLNYDPAMQDHMPETPITVEVPNPGFEDGDGASPADWRTITSNPLGAGIFERDEWVKRSGRYSLKVSPAIDPETGISYAFIIRAKTFAVNPASDVIYTVWLRADAPDTPVDVALLDATYKGQGTFVKRVNVGTEWEQFQLPCRLHNEIFDAYVGFKVYSGTVWADDARLETVTALGAE
jgi:hypothetical protein